MLAKLQFSKKKSYEFFSALGFILLILGFVIYHDLVGREILPRFLGGFFSWISSAVLFLLMIPSVFLLLSRSRTGDGFAQLIITLYFYIASLIIWHWVWASSVRESAAVYQAANLLMLWVALTFIGLWLPIQMNFIRRSMWLAFYMSASLLFWYVVTTNSVMYHAASFSGVDGVASYQGYARSALVGLLFLIAVSDFHWQRILVYVGGIFILFVLGARSELFSFIAVVPVYFTFSSARSPRMILVLAITFLLLSSAASAYWDWLIQSRQLQVLNLNEASSWLARQQLLIASWQVIAANPLTGDFGSHVRIDGSTGSYAHNILSGWSSYGLIGFFLISIASVWATIASAVLVFRHSTSDKDVAFSFLLNAAVLLLLLVAKSVFWPLPGLAWGFYLAVYKRRAFRRHSNADARSQVGFAS